MLAEVEKGNIGTIIVKDMSRLGRNYVQMGMLREQLRGANVRLIAVNEGVDTGSGYDDDFLPLRYYRNNEEGLMPYQSQGLELPEHPEGLECRNMGTMENHVWSVIARRMKHNHTSWNRRGGNHLAKILAKKCGRKLYEVTKKLRYPVFEEEKTEELYGEILMSAKAPKTDGKGYSYPAVGRRLVGLEGKITGDRRKLLSMAGF